MELIREELENHGYVSIQKIDVRDAKTIFIDSPVRLEMGQTNEDANFIEVLVKEELKDKVSVITGASRMNIEISVLAKTGELVILVPKKRKYSIRW